MTSLYKLSPYIWISVNLRLGVVLPHRDSCSQSLISCITPFVGVFSHEWVVCCMQASVLRTSIRTGLSLYLPNIHLFPAKSTQERSSMTGMVLRGLGTMGEYFSIVEIR
ncbi:hypothetical protein QAD02_018431 [Eretmocerus hayati]|uniref:Uncharacterized protein n=1 Tax=Eretmocerus hayati TaxID=131215 RepID=A0ACC2PJ60_9HYME|nr:hypothetical protein QAD02_018431 [Eretmocerus hayati]